MTFEQLYEAHAKRVYNLALHYVQQPEDAEEIAQDVFVAVHKSLSSFQEKSKHATWIYRITINKSLDFIKARNRKKRFGKITSLFAFEESGQLPSFDHPGIQMEQKEALEKIFACLNTLPANQKTALILSKLEYKSVQEIGEIMNLRSKAVESLMHRAKENLKKKLSSTEG